MDPDSKLGDLDLKQDIADEASTVLSSNFSSLNPQDPKIDQEISNTLTDEEPTVPPTPIIDQVLSPISLNSNFSFETRVEQDSKAIEDEQEEDVNINLADQDPTITPSNRLFSFGGHQKITPNNRSFSFRNPALSPFNNGFCFGSKRFSPNSCFFSFGRPQLPTMSLNKGFSFSNTKLDSNSEQFTKMEPDNEVEHLKLNEDDVDADTNLSDEDSTEDMSSFSFGRPPRLLDSVFSFPAQPYYAGPLRSTTAQGNSPFSLYGNQNFVRSSDAESADAQSVRNNMIGCQTPQHPATGTSRSPISLNRLAGSSSEESMHEAESTRNRNLREITRSDMSLISNEMRTSSNIIVTVILFALVYFVLFWSVLPNFNTIFQDPIVFPDTSNSSSETCVDYGPDII